MESKTLIRQQQAMFQIDSLPVEPEKKTFSIKCNIRNRDMEAFVTVSTSNLDCGISVFDVLKTLFDNGISVGINYDTIEEMIEKKWFNRDIPVASGFPPLHGENAVMLPQVELRDLNKPKSGAPVDLDKVVIEKTPATSGIPGFTVLGKHIDSKPGKDIEFNYGDNLEISKDGLSLKATIPGLAGLKDGKACIVEPDYGEWKFETRLRNNNMKAVLVITPGIYDKPEITDSMFTDILSSNSITFGIAPQISTLIPPRITMTTVINVAEGKPPEQGKGSVVVERFKETREDGEKLYRAAKGDLLVERIPAQPGNPGKNVLGDEIPPEEFNNVELIAGINTRLSEDGNLLYSEIDGYVSRAKEGYCAVEVRDFDLSKENLPSKIDFDGMVRVSGDIYEGHTIIAGHHIVVTGSVSSSDIVSGGILKIHGAVKNCEKTRIQSSGDMHIGSVDQARLRSGGDVFFSGPVTTCEIITDGGIFSAGRKPFSISDGKVVSGGSVETGALGDIKESKTIIEAGVPLIIRSRYEQTVRSINVLNKRIKTIITEHKRLTNLARVGKLHRTEYNKIQKLKLLHQVCVEKLRQQKGNISKLLPVILKGSGKSRISAQECTYPGTALKIGIRSYIVDKKIDGAVFRVSDNNKSIITDRVKSSKKKNMTILFTDIVNYSGYTSQYGDSAANRLLSTHNKLLFPGVENFSGRIVKTIGDSIMAVFANADDAVSSAIKMQETLDSHNSTAPKEHHIKIRIGMNTGTGILEGNDVFGDVVNMASRVEGLAGGDEIFMSSFTYNALKEKNRSGVMSLGMKKLKGKEELVEVFEIAWSD